MKISITGPQGSGKTTQAKLLADHLEIPMISIGEIMRKRSEVDDELGKTIKEDLDNGSLVDDEIVAEQAKKEVSSATDGFVMDGYPRSIHQMDLFDPVFDKVLYLDITDDEVERRLRQRNRIDDTDELIKERLNIYHQETEPLLSYYKDQNVLNIIDGTKSIEEIQGEIEKIVND